MQCSAGLRMLLPMLYIVWTLAVPMLSEILPTTTELIESSSKSTTSWPASESDNDVNFYSYDGTENNEVHHEASDNNFSDQTLDVNATIEEVLNIIAGNPNLPRLSRSEILEILENLTMSQDTNVKEELVGIKSTDENNLSFPSDYKSREEYAKALMLVLPFTAKNMSEYKIQELYTKAPVTQIINNSPEHDRTILTQSDYTNDQSHESTKSVNKQYDISYTSLHDPTVPKVRTHPAPKQPSKHLETFSSKAPKPSTKSNEELTQSQHQHEMQNPSQLNVVFQTTQQPTTTFMKYNPQTQNDNIQLQLSSDMKGLISFDIHDQILTTTAAPERITLFMTPPSDELDRGILPLVTEKMRYSSQQLAQTFGGITEVPYGTTENSAMNTNVKDILASIGLFPDLMKTEASYIHPVIETTPKAIPLSDISLAAESLTPDMKQLLVSFGLLPSETQEHTETALYKIADLPYHNLGVSPTIDPSSYLGFKPLPLATESTGSKQGHNKLSSDMNKFLASFSLVPMPESASQQNFRSQKALNTTKTEIKEKSENKNSKLSGIPNVNMEMMTDEMREVLETLGLVPSSKSKKNPSFKEDESGHIFNPSEHSSLLNHTEEDAKRLNTLLEAIKQFVEDNSTFTPEEVQAIHKSFALSSPSESSQKKESTTIMTMTTTVPKFIPKKNSTRFMPLDQIENAPDPLALEELLQLYNTNKNEVKRQQPNDTSHSSTIKISDVSTTTQNTEERNPSFDALADSFGGGETASSDLNVEEQLPATRPNGLYFLLDWNSFLEVGEEGKNKVNLRIAPKIGDSRNFLPVNVP